MLSKFIHSLFLHSKHWTKKFISYSSLNSHNHRVVGYCSLLCTVQHLRCTNLPTITKNSETWLEYPTIWPKLMSPNISSLKDTNTILLKISIKILVKRCLAMIKKKLHGSESISDLACMFYLLKNQEMLINAIILCLSE